MVKIFYTCGMALVETDLSVIFGDTPPIDIVFLMKGGRGVVSYAASFFRIASLLFLVPVMALRAI